MALGSWFSSLWRKHGPEIAAAAAIASGNPELAVPASQAAAATIKPKKPSEPALQAPTAVQPPPGGFAVAWQALTPIDRDIVLGVGAVGGVLVLAKILSPSGRRR